MRASSPSTTKSSASCRSETEMRLLTLMTAALLAASSTAVSAAESLGIAGEALVQLKGTVVDVACEIAKECRPDCGAGKRQLGLRTLDGKLYPVAKSNVDFMGG